MSVVDSIKRKLSHIDGPKPRFLCDLDAFELIYGQPEHILDYNDFRPYQKWMATTAIKQNCFLAADMGLGKTAACLWAAHVWLSAGVYSSILIVAPLRVAEETWPAEIAKWAFAREHTFRVITGSEEERIAALRLDAEITIINRDGLPWLQRYLVPSEWTFEALIYDEASRLKSGRKRTKPKARVDGTVPPKQLTELGVLKRHRAQIKRVVELSGTPAPNGLLDLWGPIYLMDGGLRLGTSMTAYEKRWFQTNRWSKHAKPEAFEHSEAEIMSRIKDVFFSLKEEDYLSLPPVVEVDHRVHLTPVEMQKYRDFEREMATYVRNHAGEEELIKAVNQGVLLNKLLQFANGSLYLDDKTDRRIHDHKLDVLGSIMQEAAGNPVLLAYSFQFDRDAILKRFPYARLYGQTTNDMRDWNSGRIPLLIMHPGSAGHGLNFQAGGHIAVWYGLTWSLELYQQFYKRLPRSGQKASRVFMHRIIAEGTADLDVLRVLRARGATQDRITDVVRVRLGVDERMAA